MLILAKCGFFGKSGNFKNSELGNVCWLNVNWPFLLWKGVPKASSDQVGVIFEPIWKLKPKVHHVKKMNSWKSDILCGFWPKSEMLKKGQKLIFRFRQHLLTKCCLTIFPVQRGPKGVSWPNLSRFEEVRSSSLRESSRESRDLVRLVLIEIED